MAIAGLVGGLGPESTIDYYRLIVAEYRKRLGTGAKNSPPIVIDSLDVEAAIAMLNANQLGHLATYVSDSAARLQGGLRTIA